MHILKNPLLAAAFSLALSPAAAFDVQAILANSGVLHAGVNAEFEQHRSTPAQLFFEFDLPDESDALLVRVRPENDPGYMTVQFGQPDGVLVETLGMMNVAVPEGATDDRLAALGHALSTIFFPMLTQQHSEASVMRVVPVTTGRYPAVELLGRYHESRRGLIYVRMLGLLPPSGEASLVAYSMMNATVLNPQTDTDLASSFGGHVINTLRFTARRDADGELVPF